MVQSPRSVFSLIVHSPFEPCRPRVCPPATPSSCLPQGLLDVLSPVPGIPHWLSSHRLGPARIAPPQGSPPWPSHGRCCPSSLTPLDSYLKHLLCNIMLFLYLLICLLRLSLSTIMQPPGGLNFVLFSADSPVPGTVCIHNSYPINICRMNC